MKIKIILLLVLVGQVLFVQAQLLTPEIKVQQIENGTIGIGVVEIFNDNAPRLRFNYNDEQKYQIGVQNQTNGYFFISDLTDNKTRLLINGDGKVGINTATPYENFSIYGASGADAQAFGIGPTSGRKWIIKVNGFSNDRTVGHYPLIISRDMGTNDGDFIIQNHGNNFNFVVQTNGYVGIGYPNPSYPLHVNGAVYSQSTQLTSDRKLKKNITSYEEGLSLIKQINTVKYQYIVESDSIEAYNIKHRDKKKVPEHIGVIAQELQQIAPDLISSFLDNDGQETLAYDFSSFTFLLVNAIKEQQQMIDEMKKQMDTLQKEIQTLQSDKK